MEGVIQVLGFLRPESRALDELIARSDQVRFSVDRLLLHSVLLISHFRELTFFFFFSSSFFLRVDMVNLRCVHAANTKN